MRGPTYRIWRARTHLSTIHSPLAETLTDDDLETLALAFGLPMEEHSLSSWRHESMLIRDTSEDWVDVK